MIRLIQFYKNNIVSNKERKQLAENIFSLGVLQALNYILPLITFPYTIRIIGPEKYGLLAFASATISYFQVIIEFGFNLTAPKSISINRDDKSKLSEIFSAIIIIKIVLYILSLFLLTILLIFIKKFNDDWLIYILTYSVIFGQIFFPVWFFQGMEKMRYITIFNVIARFISTPLIFLVIKVERDFYKIPILNALSNIVIGISSLVILYKEFKIKFKILHSSILIKYFIEAWPIFISRLATSMYTISTTFILGLFTSNTIVGYYSAADKIIQIAKSFNNPLSQSLYPFITRRVKDNSKNGLIIIRKITLYVGLGNGLISILILLFSKMIINTLMGSNMYQSIVPLRIMSFLPLIISLSNIFGVQTLIPFGKIKAFSSILISGSILNIIFSLILVPKYQHIGSAISVTLVETFITLTMLIYLQNHDLHVIKIS